MSGYFRRAKNQAVTRTGAPTAMATRTPADGGSPLPVSFDGSGSTDPENDTLSYDWNYGDGSAPVVLDRSTPGPARPEDIRAIQPTAHNYR